MGPSIVRVFQGNKKSTMCSLLYCLGLFGTNQNVGLFRAVGHTVSNQTALQKVLLYRRRVIGAQHLPKESTRHYQYVPSNESHSSSNGTTASVVREPSMYNHALGVLLVSQVKIYLFQILVPSFYRKCDILKDKIAFLRKKINILKEKMGSKHVANNKICGKSLNMNKAKK